MMAGWKEEIKTLLAEDRLFWDDRSREKLSKDYYWYSPVLKRQLDSKVADVIVCPEDEREVALVLAFACRNRIPVTVRGAGTGNYGQAIPLHGGIVLDVSRLDKILELGEGYARVQCGVRLGTLEKKARENGQELRIYPSTFMKATVGGFVCGGSGGIGSISWGNLWDGNVREAVVYTMEEMPRRLIVQGEELFNYIHNYGTTGVLTELTVMLAPRREWAQSVVHFDSFEQALRFSEEVAKDDTVAKRLVCTLEWPIPSYFTPLLKVLEPDAAAVLLETDEANLPSVHLLAKRYDGRLGYVIPAASYRKTIGLSDFSWNHTTLWAIKADPVMTYLQAGFSPFGYLEQVKKIKEAFGEEVLLHFEWIRSGGELTPSSLPIIKFQTEQRLYEIIRFFESVGVTIFDPHTWILDDGGRGDVENMKRKKRENDPFGLLNPGKIHYEVQHAGGRNPVV